MKNNFQKRRAMQLAAIRDDRLPDAKQEAKDKIMMALAGDYDKSALFYWLKRFVIEIRTGVSRFGKLRSQHTIAGFEYQLLWFAAYLKDNGLDKIAPEDFTSKHLIAFLEPWNDTPRTKKQMFANARQMFNFLLQEADCKVKHNPASKVPTISYKRKPTRKIADPKDLNRLFKAMKTIERRGSATEQAFARAQDIFVLTFMLATGCRRNALIGLALSSFDWEERTVSYEDKGKNYTHSIDEFETELKDLVKSRIIHGRRSLESYDDYLLRMKKFNDYHPSRSVRDGYDDGYLLRQLPGNMFAGCPVSLDSISSYFERWSKWLGDGDKALRPHMLRKYRGMVAYRKNKDIVQVMTMLGHSSIEMTRQYLEISEFERQSSFIETSILADLRG